MRVDQKLLPLMLSSCCSYALLNNVLFYYLLMHLQAHLMQILHRKPNLIGILMSPVVCARGLSFL